MSYNPYTLFVEVILMTKPDLWLEELRATCNDLMEDAVLIQALERYARAPGTLLLPQEALGDTRLRLADYLLQHAQDLDCLILSAPAR